MEIKADILCENERRFTVSSAQSPACIYTLHYWAGERQGNSRLNTTSILINCAHQNILYIQYRRIGIMRTFCFGSINKLILYSPARVYKESDTAVYLYQINTNW